MQALNELNEGGGGLPHTLAGDAEGDGSSHGKAGRGCGEQRSVLPSLPFGFWVLACTSVIQSYSGIKKTGFGGPSAVS